MFSRTFLLCLLGVLIASPHSSSIGRVIKPSRKREVIAINGRAHTPQQLTKLIDQSALAYIVEPLSDSPGARAAAPPTDEVSPRVPPLTPADFERGRISPPPDTIAALFRLGDAACKTKQYTRARELFWSAFALDTTRHTALEGVARTFADERQYDSAGIYYRRSLKLFAPDYETHRLLAEARWVAGDTLEALRELTLAHVLNPNDASTREKLRERRSAIGQPWRDWQFSPRYRIVREGQAVRIQSDSSSLGYALAKALWKHEPGYAETMCKGQPPLSGKCNLVEEEEALALQGAAHQAGSPLHEVVSDGLTREYILYEMTLPRDPKVVLTLDWPTLLRMADYVTKYH